VPRKAHGTCMAHVRSLRHSVVLKSVPLVEVTAKNEEITVLKMAELANARLHSQ
jgi:hypothetical protein